MRLRRIDAMTKVLRTGEDMTPIHPEEESYFKLLGGGMHLGGGCAYLKAGYQAFCQAPAHLV